ncbi:hypothetical protein [Kamptonema formosum]|nr:hypothetical protein [Oscillatoria sp. PCC 10802]
MPAYKVYLNSTLPQKKAEHSYGTEIITIICRHRHSGDLRVPMYRL